MDSQEINASRRRFLTAMLAVGAAQRACAVPADQKSVGCR
ncbi:trimethylamine-N-oxide reductase 1 [Salmonella enterica subsp. arizonae]|uniref:Trimethylamine-N-oxide reductase 1 n=1 Tax=Salmonella enterica subsp. arizonae TaxID=59203 RepID=A0A447R1N5_SALER|nr:trimethylamine-N-oxide reductase 1 [Salmonella enterica subsp. arizonae]